MILVDSSVWIDYFRGASTREAEHLDRLLGREALLMGDIILAEVLQGFTSDSAFDEGLRVLSAFDTIEIGGRDIAVRAARHFRTLRGKGVTIRKTIDTLIATRCIADGHSLLFSDRDFAPFVDHLELRSAL